MSFFSFVPLLLLLSLSVLPAFSQDDGCTLCFGNDPPGSPDGTLYGETMSCRAAVTQVPLFVTADTDGCREVQSDAFILCGCPTLPPKNPIAYCSVCVDSAPMNRPSRVIDGLDITQPQVTCEQYNDYLSNSIFTYVHEQEGCTSLQQVLGEMCGCSSTLETCPLCAEGSSPVAGYESIVVGSGVTSDEPSTTCGDLEDFVRARYWSHERKCGYNQHQATNAGCCTQNVPAFRKPTCALCEHGPPINANTVLDDPVFDGVATDVTCGSLYSELTYLDPQGPINCAELLPEISNIASVCTCPAPPAPAPTFGICFSGQTVVNTKTQGPVRMEDLHVGDKVMTASGTYEAVYAFGHRQPNVFANYLKIYPSGLEISHHHMLFLENGEAIPAFLLKVGDILTSGEQVVSIEVISAKGAYAPFTISGDIVVNGVTASCYVSFQNESKKQGITSYFESFVSFHWLAHTATFPLRLWYQTMGSTVSEMYTKEGISTWIYHPYLFAQWLFQPEQGWLTAFLKIVLWVPMSILVTTFVVLDVFAVQMPQVGLLVLIVMSLVLYSQGKKKDVKVKGE